MCLDDLGWSVRTHAHWMRSNFNKKGELETEDEKV